MPKNMSYIRQKVINGIKYIYRVKSIREGKKVRQKFLGYVGRTDKIKEVLK